ncbi:MAG: hypothetical protein FJX78_01900, partial [Armatimonadetes bacterium]|nr:hypothetical protein [Armatimonadota bacterium]
MVRPIAMWLALVFVAALAASPAVAQPAPRILVQHQDARGVPSAVMRGDTLFAPLDGLLRPYGASARWDPAARAAEISGGRGIRVTLRAGEPRMIVNGESYALPA